MNNSHDPHGWLAEFQAQFGSAIRQPLAIRDGRLAPAAFDPKTIEALGVLRGSRTSAEQALQTYQMQFWLRCFSVFQSEFPCFNAVVGPWQLNLLAMQFLTEHPARANHFDIRAMTDDFANWMNVARWRSCHDSDALEFALVAEALALDAAFSSAAAAPEARPLKIAPGAALPTRVRQSPGVALARESWNLLALRAYALENKPDSRLPVGSRLGQSRPLLIMRTQRGFATQVLDHLQAGLYQLVAEYPLAVAVEMLAQSPAAAPLETLGPRVSAWMQYGARLGLWEDASNEPMTA